jgi:hypothetical protein
MERVVLAILSLVQSFYDNRSLKQIRYILLLGFEEHIEEYYIEEHIETIFKFLNAQAIQNLLLPRSGCFSMRLSWTLAPALRSSATPSTGFGLTATAVLPP